MLVHIKKIVPKAKRGKYAIGAFNTANLETTLAIARGAMKTKSPVIIQVSEKTVRYAGLRTINNIVKTIAENIATKIPIAIHLDHGKNVKLIKECVKVGFSSVHIDASELPFNKNVSLTKKVVDFAHKKKVWVQGELGCMLGKEGLVKLRGKKLKLEDFMTDPDKVKEYVRKTKVDTLAVSVGTIHGYFKGEEKIDFERLKKISRCVKVPLVLHGGSGVEPKEIKKAVKLGITIVNIDTELRIASTKTLKRTLKKELDLVDPRKVLSPSTEAMQRVVEEKMRLFGSVNKM